MHRLQIILFPVLSIFILISGLAADVIDLDADIYPKLRDSRCDMPVDKCSCPEASEIKAYILSLANTGVERDELFYLVAKKFSLNNILDIKMRRAVEKRLIEEFGDERPQIVFRETRYDFKKVSKKQGQVKHLFYLQNKGKKALIINDIRAFCSCTSISVRTESYKSPYFGINGAPPDWKVELKPGEKAALEVILDIGHHSVTEGFLTRDLAVNSNDPIYPRVIIKVEANVQEQ